MDSISNTAHQATENVKEAASHARTTLLDLSMQVLKLVNSARAAEGRGVDVVLDRLGLERRRSALGPVLWFAAGAVAAGAAVMLTAPDSGKKLRQRIGTFISGGVETLATKAEAIEHQVEEVVKHPMGATKPANGAKHQVG